MKKIIYILSVVSLAFTLNSCEYGGSRETEPNVELNSSLESNIFASNVEVWSTKSSSSSTSEVNKTLYLKNISLLFKTDANGLGKITSLTIKQLIFAGDTVINNWNKNTTIERTISYDNVSTIDYSEKPLVLEFENSRLTNVENYLTAHGIVKDYYVDVIVKTSTGKVFAKTLKIERNNISYIPF